MGHSLGAAKLLGFVGLQGADVLNLTLDQGLIIRGEVIHPIGIDILLGLAVFYVLMLVEHELVIEAPLLDDRLAD